MKRARWITRLFVAVACCSTAGTMCSGWSASASERMACCAYLDHPCSHATADDCCAAGEQRQHGETDASPSIAAPPLTPAAVATIVAPPPDALAIDHWLAAPRVLGSPPDTHLLLSVFLI